MAKSQNEEELGFVKGGDVSAQDKGKTATAKRGPKPAGADPYIRALFGIAALVIIGALLTVIFAYLSGVIDLDADRASNIDQFTVARSMAYAESERTAGSLSQLAMAQIANENWMQAEMTIQEAIALNSPDEERNQGPLFASAHLALAQGDADIAKVRFEQVMSQLREDFDSVQ